MAPEMLTGLKKILPPNPMFTCWSTLDEIQQENFATMEIHLMISLHQVRASLPLNIQMIFFKT